MNQRICISGIGVISPIGIGREAYWAGLSSGQDGVSEINLFDGTSLQCRLAAEVENFNASALLGSKGLRYIDRPGRFVLAASTLAIEDAALCLDKIDPSRRGIVLGTGYGGVSSEYDFSRDRVLEGPKWVSPAKFPNTPINALSYQVPIRYQMKRANVTLSSGMTSSLDAIRYAALTLQQMPDSVLLCGGVEELCLMTHYTAYFMDELAGTSGEEVCCPFDVRRNGYILGEGSTVLVMETTQNLSQRGGKGLVEIRGFGSGFAPPKAERRLRVNAVSTAIRRAIRNAEIRPDQIDLILAAANSGREGDVIEASALQEVFGDNFPSIPVSAIKSMIGEAFGASGSMQIAAATLALTQDVLPPTINLKTLDPECHSLNCVTEIGRRCHVRYALVNSIDRYGGAVSVILRSFDG